MYVSKKQLEAILGKSINVAAEDLSGLVGLCQVTDKARFRTSKKKFRVLLSIIRANFHLVDSAKVILVSELDEYNLSISFDTYWFSTVAK